METTLKWNWWPQVGGAMPPLRDLEILGPSNQFISDWGTSDTLQPCAMTKCSEHSRNGGLDEDGDGVRLLPACIRLRRRHSGRTKRWLRPITGNGRIIHLFTPSPSAPTLITPHHSAPVAVWQRRPWQSLLYAYPMICSWTIHLFSPQPPWAPNLNNPHPSSAYSAGMAKRPWKRFLCARQE